MIMTLRMWLALPMAYSVRWLIRHSSSASDRVKYWNFSRKYINVLGFVAEVKCGAAGRMRLVSTSLQEQHLFYFGLWEPRLTSYLLNHSPGRGVFLDIGSNIGYFTLVATGKFDRVVAVEASPDSYKRPTAHIARNDISNVKAVNRGIADVSGELPFYRRRGRLAGDTFVHEPGAELDSMVPVAPLSHVLSDVDLDQVTSIKIDVEGFDHLVLNQVLDDLPQYHRLEMIALEYDPGLADLWRVVERARSLGFKTCLLQGAYDLEHYVCSDDLAELAPLTIAPAEFSDVILLRTAPA